jgi:hypothetical protein
VNEPHFAAKNGLDQSDFVYAATLFYYAGTGKIDRNGIDFLAIVDRFSDKRKQSIALLINLVRSEKRKEILDDNGNTLEAQKEIVEDQKLASDMLSDPLKYIPLKASKRKGKAKEPLSDFQFLGYLAELKKNHDFMQSNGFTDSIFAEAYFYLNWATNFDTVENKFLIMNTISRFPSEDKEKTSLLIKLLCTEKMGEILDDYGDTEATRNLVTSLSSRAIDILRSPSKYLMKMPGNNKA